MRYSLHGLPAAPFCRHLFVATCFFWYLLVAPVRRLSHRRRWGRMPTATSPVSTRLLKKMGRSHQQPGAAVASTTFVSSKVALAAYGFTAGAPKKARLPPKRGQVKARIVGSLVRSVVTIVSKGEGRDAGGRSDGAAAVHGAGAV